MRQLISCAVVVGLITGTAVPATAAERVALVIGNSAYQNTEPLPNPVNDGRAVAAALRRLDFNVIEALDQDRAGMRSALRQFSAELEGAEVSLFFYAGHGLQVQRRNYMVPVDAALESELDLPFEAVAVDMVIELMEQVTPQRLVFLDACRNNPLARNLTRSAGKSRSVDVGAGLARMNSRVGTLIAFATEPDQVALDGDGEHSPFTYGLLEHIDTPGIEIRQMLSRVRASVIQATGGQQLPLDTSALVEDFYFVPPAAPPSVPAVAAPAVTAPATPAAEATASSGASTEHLFWSTIQGSTDPDDFQAYLERYPDGAFAPLARNRLSDLNPAPQSEMAALTPPAATPPATPPPVAEIEVEAVDTTVVATRNVNIRSAPNTNDDPLGLVPQGTEVAVTGKVIGADWYRIERPDGGQAYVYAPLFVSPGALAAAVPEPAPSSAPASAPAQAGAAAQRAEPPQASGPADAVQTAAITSGVAAPDKAPATRAGPVPAPHVDAASLLQTLGERKPNSRLRFMYQIKGDQGAGFVAFNRWKEVGSSDDAPTLLAGGGAQSRVQESSETFGQAVMATQVTPEMFGVLMYSRAIHGGRANFTTQSVSSAIGQWVFLGRHGARVEATSSTTFDGVKFEVAALTLNNDAPASTCLGFVAFQGGRRVDGFVCRPAGPAFDVAQANAVVSQIRVPRFIEP